MRGSVSRGRLLAALLATTAFSVLVAVYAVRHARPGQEAVAALLHGGIVALPIFVGLWVVEQGFERRFARALIALGVLAAPLVLVQSSHAGAYAAGRITFWLLQPAVLFVILAFPSGRLAAGWERAIVGGAVAVVAVLYLPTVLLVEHFPQPALLPGCEHACPANPLMVTAHQPAWVDDVLRPIRETLLVAAFLAAFGVLLMRARTAGALMRRALVAVAAGTLLYGAAETLFFISRHDFPGAIDAARFLAACCLPVIAISFALGMAQRRMAAVAALGRLADQLGRGASDAELQAALAEVLEDPTVQVLRRPGGIGPWVDLGGRPVAPPDPDSGRTVALAGGDAEPRLAVVDDARLSLDPALVSAAAAYVLALQDNRALVARLRASMAEVAESRARIVAETDEARRRIERDLHDGAQQSLIALRMRLGIARDRAAKEAPDVAETLDELGTNVQDIIEEIRNLAQGIYPALLAQRGLGAALSSVAWAAPVPTLVDGADLGRYPKDVETNVYFACLEALQNVAKHAEAGQVVITLAETDGALEFAVEDDGRGFDPAVVAAGAGLAGIRDRLAALDGTIEIDSAPGHGTRVRGRVPLAGTG